MKLKLKSKNILIFHSDSPESTQHFGYLIGDFLFKQIAKKKSEDDFFMIALMGEYGAGKTVFVKGVCRNLKSSSVVSPTFILMNMHSSNNKNVIHIDACRIKSEKEFIMLGTEDFYSNSLVLVEWADKILNCLPDKRIDLSIKITGTNKRILWFLNRTGCDNLFIDFKKNLENRTC